MEKEHESAESPGRQMPLLYDIYDKASFEQMREYLRAGARAEELKGLLESIGIEESYQRCCCGNHAQENLLYALYELVRRASEGKGFEKISYWQDAVGKRVRACYACAETLPAIREAENGRWTIENRLVLCLDENAVVVEGSPNLYLCADEEAFADMQRQDISEQLAAYVGQVIEEVRFRHRTVSGDDKQHVQGNIFLVFASGAALRISTDFGETPGKACIYFEMLPELPDDGWDSDREDMDDSEDGDMLF